MDESQPREAGAPHELFEFMRQVTDEMAAEYRRIVQRSREDPGTAGDEGEENWAALLRDWLPPQYHVETKGRLLSHEGRAGPQLDVLVLHPSHPPKMRQKKLYMASAVLAAFECKLTLRSEHLEQLFHTAAEIHDLKVAREGNPYDELHHPIVFGLLAHSHHWRAPASHPEDNVGNAIDRLHQRAPHACDLPDFICIADLGTWPVMKFSSAGLFFRDPLTHQRKEGAPEDVDECPVTEYLKPTNLPPTPEPTQIGSMFAKLLMRLQFEEPSSRSVADYFRMAGLLGSGEGFSKRIWESSYTDAVKRGMPSRLVNAGDSRWGLGFL